MVPDCSHLAQERHLLSRRVTLQGCRKGMGQPGWQMPLKEHGSGPSQLCICARVRLTGHMRITAADNLTTCFWARTATSAQSARLLRQLFAGLAPRSAYGPRWLSTFCKASNRCASGGKAASVINVHIDDDRESSLGSSCGLTLPCLLLPGRQGLHSGPRGGNPLEWRCLSSPAQVHPV